MFGWEAVVGCIVALTCFAFFPRIHLGEWKEWFLVVLSVVVLAFWQPAGLLITVGMTAVAWLTIIGREKEKGPFPCIPTSVGIILLLAPLVISKSLPLLNSPSQSVAGSDLTRWFVPLGLSFTSFRLIGVLLDSTALKIPVSFSRLALLSFFFPTFPSGPITTLQSLKELGNEYTWSSELLPAGERILAGIARKVLLADTLKEFVIDPWLAQGVGQLEPFQCLVLPVVFGMYIYWDFAGYSDMAIGIARLLGYRVPENFNRPYMSRNLIDFWRRWHITLSEWIRVRLMMKIAGRRAGIVKLSIATIISMSLCGLWHGFGWGYFLWGIWHGIGLVAVHLVGEAGKRSERLRNAIRRTTGAFGSTFLTFIYVTIGWVWFFLPVRDGAALIQRGMQWRGGDTVEFLVPVGVAAGLTAIYIAGNQGKHLWERLPLPVRGTFLAGLLGLVVYAVLYRHGVKQEFIYTQF